MKVIETTTSVRIRQRRILVQLPYLIYNSDILKYEATTSATFADDKAILGSNKGTSKESMVLQEYISILQTLLIKKKISHRTSVTTSLNSLFEKETVLLLSLMESIIHNKVKLNTLTSN